MKRRPTPAPTATAEPRPLDMPPHQTETLAAGQLTASEVIAMLETVLANRGGGYSPIVIINCNGNYGVICGENNATATLQDRHTESNAQTVNADHNARADIIGAHNAAESGARLQADDTTANIPRAQIAGDNSRQMQTE